MTHDEELINLMQSVALKSLQLMRDFTQNKVQLSHVVEQMVNWLKHIQDLVHMVLKNPQTFWEMQYNYWHAALDLTQNQMLHWLNNKPMPIDDKRFSFDAWASNPFFNVLGQHYLLASSHLTAFLEKINHQDKTAVKKLQFFTKQYLDALSPTNFLHTNPEILAETLESRGKNLLSGLSNLLSDITALEWSPKMTDASAFKVGENLAVTPGKVIFQNDMMELIQYSPQTKTTQSIPLLIIPPWINKYYILDLSPQKSLIQWLVEQKITVFVISWVNPDARFAKKSLYDYLNEGPRTAIKVIKKQLATPRVNTLGYCIGGTLLTLLLAYNQAKKDKSIQSATFLASLIDFNEPGDIAVFIDEQQIKKIEDKMASFGYLDGKFMARSFNSLRANDLIWSYFVKNYLSGKTPVPMDILYWNSDVTHMPALMHSQYLRWMYLQNDLIKPNKIQLNHTPIDISTINVPTFFISCERDHIAPWKTTYLGYQRMKGKKEFLLGGSGHVAGIINPPSIKKYAYYTNRTSPNNAEAWFKQAKEHPGSWWPYWCKWLQEESGPLRLAPEFHDLPFKPIMDAPGRYVLKK